MYLNINGVRHSVARRIVTTNTIKYIGVMPTPEAITGDIRMYRNDGFLMSLDDSSKFSRKLISGSLVQLTNIPEPDTSPLPPVPDPPAAKVVTAVVG